MLALFIGSVNPFQTAIISAMLLWGCVSYFGWINYIVEKFEEIELEREYWWNFFAENLMIQSSALIVNFNVFSVVLAVVFAGISAFGKVWIDSDSDGYLDVLGFDVREDVASEWWHGFSNCILLAVNIAI
jgi:hypothetical protein